MAIQFTSTVRFLVGALATNQTVPTAQTLTVTAAADAGDDTLTVSATTGYLSSGVEIQIGSTLVKVRQDTPRGSTTLPIEPLAVGETITSSATGTYYELFEFIGGSDIQIAGQENTISIRNFKSGQWAYNAKVMTGVSFTCQGQYHTDDYALRNVIRPAFFTLGKEIYAELTRENGDVWSGNFLVNGYSEGNALDNVVTVSFTLNSNGVVVIPAPAVLTA